VSGRPRVAHTQGSLKPLHRPPGRPKTIKPSVADPAPAVRVLHGFAGFAFADATKMTVIATVLVYFGGSRALMSFSSSFSCRTSSSKRSRREGAGAEAIEGPVIDSSVRAGIVTAPLNRCA
jgi:hypothetical protein